jgi:selenide,water dikinase
MPIGQLSTQTIGKILKGGQSVCQAAGIPIAGGHTIDSVEAIYGLVVMGLVHPKKLKRNADTRPGDVIILGKPLGVGIYSAALKKAALSEAGYRLMVETATRLNRPGADLAEIDQVHAVTDVTGFGLAGHALEMARGAGVQIAIDWHAVPLLPETRAFVDQGFITGASGRNWAGYGKEVRLPAGFSESDRAILTDPQTSGGLLVSCTAAAAHRVEKIFADHGFAACRIGTAEAGAGLLIR